MSDDDDSKPWLGPRGREPLSGRTSCLVARVLPNPQEHHPSGRRLVKLNSRLAGQDYSCLSVAGLRSINLEFHSFGCRLAQGSMVAT